MPEEKIYMSMYSKNAELYHHGIQGQKWGIQNGPPYPLSKEESNRIKKEAKQNVKDARKELRKTYTGKRMVTGAVVGTLLGGPIAGVAVAYGAKWLINSKDEYSKVQYEEAAKNLDNAIAAKRTVQHIIDESKATTKDLNKKDKSNKSLHVVSYDEARTSSKELQNAYKEAREKMKTYDEQRGHYYFDTSKLTDSDFKKMAKIEFDDYNKAHPGKFSNFNDFIDEEYGGLGEYKSDTKEFLTLNG